MKNTVAYLPVTSMAVKELTFQLTKVSEAAAPLAMSLGSNNQGVLMTDNIHYEMINSL